MIWSSNAHVHTRTQESSETYNEQEFQQMSDQYSKMSQDFDRRRDDYRKDHPDTQTMPDIDWQKEVEMEQNMRLVADMQMTLQREIR